MTRTTPTQRARATRTAPAAATKTTPAAAAAAATRIAPAATGTPPAAAATRTAPAAAAATRTVPAAAVRVTAPASTATAVATGKERKPQEVVPRKGKKNMIKMRMILNLRQRNVLLLLSLPKSMFSLQKPQPPFTIWVSNQRFVKTKSYTYLNITKNLIIFI